MPSTDDPARDKVGGSPTGPPIPAALLKVRKLLALATSPNPHEAALAAARAQALIETHRLEGWLEAQSSIATDPEPIVDARETPLDRGRRMRPWKVALAGALADANRCAAYVLARADGEAIVLVGRARDRAAVLELWQWLLRRIEWLSATHGAQKSRKWHEAFRVGVVDAVAKRLAQAVSEVRESASASALVVIEPADVAHREALAAFIAENLGLASGRALSVNAAAYRRGGDASAELDVEGGRLAGSRGDDELNALDRQPRSRRPRR